MRVAMVTHSLSRNAGGLLPVVRRLAQILNENPETRMSVVGLDDEHFHEDSATWGPIAPVALPVLGPRSLGYAPRLRTWLRSVSPDITHCHGIWMFTSLACLKHRRETRRPHLISPHGMLDPWALRNSAWKKRIAGLLFENAHLREGSCLHALAQSEAQAIRRYGLKNPICIIPNGVDLPKSLTEGPPPWATDDGEERKVLLYLGRIHPKKGLPHLLEGWKMFQSSSRRARGWRLVIAGWDQVGHLDELRRYVDEHSLSSSVAFPGPLFDAAKEAAFANCEAFILPSFSEGLPMVALEAWSFSRPALLTSACNLPEAFEHGAAVKIEPDANSIAGALEEMTVASASELESIGAAGRRLVEERFTWNHVAARMRAVYEWLLGGGPPPPEVERGA